MAEPIEEKNWEWEECKNPRQLLDELFSSALGFKVAFLACAGVSFDPPSNLPTSMKFIHGLLKHVLPETELEKILDLTKRNRLDRSSKNVTRSETISLSPFYVSFRFPCQESYELSRMVSQKVAIPALLLDLSTSKGRLHQLCIS